MSVAFDWVDFQTAFREAAMAAGFSPTHLAGLSSGDLTMWERPSDGPRVYLSAGIHGDEPAGPLALLELLREGYFNQAIHWMLGPALNPTGLAALTRENACGIDLNRDYWLRETPEVLAHTQWLDARPAPDLFISLHEDWETTGFYFYEINLGTEDLDRTRSILAAVEPWFHPEPGPIIDGHDISGPGWIYHIAEPDLPEAWPEAIYLAKMGCPISFTFETPSHAPLHQRVAAHTAAVKAACANLKGARSS
ncbi:MAG: M14 family metallopeptidase [Luteolibacter sp.]